MERRTVLTGAPVRRQFAAAFTGKYRFGRLLAVLGIGTALFGCTVKDSPTKPVVDENRAFDLVPGQGIGPVQIGSSFGQVRSALGEATVVGFNRIFFATYESLGLNVILASPDSDVATDSAQVLAVGLIGQNSYSSRFNIGSTRAEVVAALGEPADSASRILYWPQGVSVEFDDGALAKAIGVFPTYKPESTPEEMGPAKTASARKALPSAAASSSVDMHLHPGFIGRMPGASKKFLIESTPPFTQLYAPGVFRSVLDPYAPFVGIQAQTSFASIDHAVLFAVYTQKTTGFFTNEELEAVLTDPRNVSTDGLPWAWGLASIDLFDGYVDGSGRLDETVSRRRLDALRSYFIQRPDLFIGIKLAHAHQAVAFDDARYLGVYDVAYAADVPVYLHTGFSPFPNSQSERPYYDPSSLENVIANYPRVKFILGHVGQGDRGAVDSAISIAARYSNVYLEISALNRPFLRDMDGHDTPPDPNQPQYPYVLDQIKAKGLVQKTLFGTDGPQYSGMVKSYSELMKQAMAGRGYSEQEVRAVMGGNFFDVFFPGHLGPEPTPDAGITQGSDAAASDDAAADAASDAGAPDAAVFDAGAPDAAGSDAGAPDAATAPLDAGAFPPDSGASNNGEIGVERCGASLICSGGQICCFTGFPSAGFHGCAVTGGCAANQLEARCDGPEDCSGGQICCGKPDGASCSAASSCTGFGSAQLCHSPSDCVGVFTRCEATQFVPLPYCRN